MPSEIVGLVDTYEAFCFNEACIHIANQIQENKKPNWREEKKDKEEIRRKNLELAKKLKERR